MGISNVNGTVTGSTSGNESGGSMNSKWTNIYYNYDADDDTSFGHTILETYTNVKAKVISSGSLSDSEYASGSYSHSEAQAVSFAIIFDGSTYKGKAVLSIGWSVSYNQNTYQNPSIDYDGKVTIYDAAGTKGIDRKLTDEELDGIAALYMGGM
jgi:hypothetical protein